MISTSIRCVVTEVSIVFFVNIVTNLSVVAISVVPVDVVIIASPSYKYSPRPSMSLSPSPPLVSLSTSLPLSPFPLLLSSPLSSSTEIMLGPTPPGKV